MGFEGASQRTFTFEPSSVHNEIRAVTTDSINSFDYEQFIHIVIFASVYDSRRGRILAIANKNVLSATESTATLTLWEVSTLTANANWKNLKATLPFESIVFNCACVVEATETLLFVGIFAGQASLVSLDLTSLQLKSTVSTNHHITQLHSHPYTGVVYCLVKTVNGTLVGKINPTTAVVTFLSQKSLFVPANGTAPDLHLAASLSAYHPLSNSINTVAYNATSGQTVLLRADPTADDATFKYAGSFAGGSSITSIVGAFSEVPVFQGYVLGSIRSSHYQLAGDRIMLRGSNIQAGPNLACVFVDNRGSGPTISPATKINDTFVSCRSLPVQPPDAAPIVTKLHLSNNGFSLSQNFVTFNFFEFGGVTPAEGLYSGNTVLEIDITNGELGYIYQCKFQTIPDSEAAKNGIVSRTVTGRYLPTKRKVECVTPFKAPEFAMNAAVDVLVSLDGAKFFHVGTHTYLGSQSPAILRSFVRADLESFSLLFDRSTDRAGLAIGKVVSADLLFKADTVALMGTAPKAFWFTSRELVGVFGPGFTARIGDLISLKDDLVDGEPVGASTDKLFKFAAGSTVLTVPFGDDVIDVLPAAQISGPTSMASCDELVLHALASILTGTSSIVYQWTYNSTLTNPAVDAAIASASAAKGIMRIPGTQLPVGRHTFGVTVSNWIQQQSPEVQITVEVLSLSVPVVIIHGGNVQKHVASQRISFSADITDSACKTPALDTLLGAAPSSILWSMFQLPSLQPVSFPSSVTLTTRSITLPSSLLSPGMKYKVVFSVAYTTGSQPMTLSDSVEVHVASSKLVSFIASGGRVVDANKPLRLDGSQSFDPDASSAPMSYIWKCEERTIITTPTEGSKEEYNPCLGQLEAVTQSTSASITVPAGSFRTFPDGIDPDTGGEVWWRFTLRVSKPGRSATSDSVIIKAVDASPSSLDFSSSALSLYKVDAKNGRVALSATITDGCADPPCGNRDLTWSVVEGVVNLAQAAVIGPAGPQLVLRRGALEPGLRYTFRLSMVDKIGVTGYGEISFLANEAPRGGSFAVSPNLGYVLTTPFVFVARDWTDDPEDFPFSYRFGYDEHFSAVRVVDIPISDWSADPIYEGSLPSLLLPPGSDQVPLFCEIRDAYGSSTVAHFSVTIQPNSNTIALLFTSLAEQKTQYTSLIALGSTTALFTLMLNMANEIDNLADNYPTTSVNTREARMEYRRSILDEAYNQVYLRGLTEPITEIGISRQMRLITALMHDPDDLDDAFIAQATAYGTALLDDSIALGHQPNKEIVAQMVDTFFNSASASSENIRGGNSAAARRLLQSQPFTYGPPYSPSDIALQNNILQQQHMLLQGCTLALLGAYPGEEVRVNTSLNYRAHYMRESPTTVFGLQTVLQPGKTPFTTDMCPKNYFTLHYDLWATPAFQSQVTTDLCFFTYRRSLLEHFEPPELRPTSCVDELQVRTPSGQAIDPTDQDLGFVSNHEVFHNQSSAVVNIFTQPYLQPVCHAFDENPALFQWIPTPTCEVHLSSPLLPATPTGTPEGTPAPTPEPSGTPSPTVSMTQQLGSADEVECRCANSNQFVTVITRFIDCEGVLDGTKRWDQCGVCDGDDSTCIGCDGSFSWPVMLFDNTLCQVCGGLGQSCDVDLYLRYAKGQPSSTMAIPGPLDFTHITIKEDESFAFNPPAWPAADLPAWDLHWDGPASCMLSVQIDVESTEQATFTLDLNFFGVESVTQPVPSPTQRLKSVQFNTPFTSARFILDTLVYYSAPNFDSLENMPHFREPKPIQISLSACDRTYRKVINFIMESVNDPPTIVYKNGDPVPISVLERGETSLTGLKFGDVDRQFGGTPKLFFELPRLKCLFQVGHGVLEFSGSTSPNDPLYQISGTGRTREITAKSVVMDTVAAQLRYLPDVFYNRIVGPEQLVVTCRDFGDFGSTEQNPGVGILAVDIDIVPVNDVPSLGLPVVPLEAYENQDCVLRGISIVDLDFTESPGNRMEVVIEVEHGTLTFPSFIPRPIDRSYQFTTCAPKPCTNVCTTECRNSTTNSSLCTGNCTAYQGVSGVSCNTSCANQCLCECLEFEVQQKILEFTPLVDDLFHTIVHFELPGGCPSSNATFRVVNTSFVPPPRTHTFPPGCPANDYSCAVLEPESTYVVEWRRDIDWLRRANATSRLQRGLSRRLLATAPPGYTLDTFGLQLLGNTTGINQQRLWLGGHLDGINAVLNELVYSPEPFFSNGRNTASNSLTISITDIPVGAPRLTVVNSARIVVQPANDPPKLEMPARISHCLEDIPCAIPVVLIDDAVQTPDDFLEVLMFVFNGNLTVPGADGLTFLNNVTAANATDGNYTATAPMLHFRGNFSSVDRSLRAMTYLNTRDFNTYYVDPDTYEGRSENLFVHVNDRGAGGIGLLEYIVEKSVPVDVKAVNDAPVIVVSPTDEHLVYVEDSPSALLLGSMVVSDVDLFEATTSASPRKLEIRIEVKFGAVSLNSRDGLDFGDVSAAQFNRFVQFSALPWDLNNAFRMFRYQVADGALNLNSQIAGPDVVTVTVSDAGFSGFDRTGLLLGGRLTTVATFEIEVIAVNDPPEIHAPFAVATSEDTPVKIPDFTIDDVDVGDCGDGKLLVSANSLYGSVSFERVRGARYLTPLNGQIVTFEGTVPVAQKVLETLVYIPAKNENSPHLAPSVEVVSIIADDQGGCSTAVNNTGPPKTFVEPDDDDDQPVFDSISNAPSAESGRDPSLTPTQGKASVQVAIFAVNDPPEAILGDPPIVDEDTVWFPEASIADPDYLDPGFGEVEILVRAKYGMVSLGKPAYPANVTDYHANYTTMLNQEVWLERLNYTDLLVFGELYESGNPFVLAPFFGVRGEMNDINAALRALIFVPMKDMGVGEDELTLEVNDLGSFGEQVTYMGHKKTVIIPLAQVNDAAKIVLDASLSVMSVDEDVSAPLLGVQLEDIDVDEDEGKLVLEAQAIIGSVFASVCTTYLNFSTICEDPPGITCDVRGEEAPCWDVSDPDVHGRNFTGTLADLNAALEDETFQFLSFPNANGRDFIQLMVTDNGFSGKGVPEKHFASIPLLIRAINDAPVVEFKDLGFDEDADTSLVRFNKPKTGPATGPLPQVYLSDADLEEGRKGIAPPPIQAMLSMKFGTISMLPPYPKTVKVEPPNGRGRLVILTGPVLDVNEVLRFVNYTGGPDFKGYDPLLVRVSDLGNYGYPFGEPTEARLALGVLVTEVSICAPITVCGDCNKNPDCGWCPSSCDGLGYCLDKGGNGLPKVGVCPPHRGVHWGMCEQPIVNYNVVSSLMGVGLLLFMMAVIWFHMWTQERHGGTAKYMRKKVWQWRTTAKKMHVLPPANAHLYQLWFACAIFVVFILLAQVLTSEDGVSFTYFAVSDAHEVTLASDGCTIEFVPSTGDSLLIGVAVEQNPLIKFSGSVCGPEKGVHVVNDKESEKYATYYCSIRILVPEGFNLPSIHVASNFTNTTIVKQGIFSEVLDFGPNTFSVRAPSVNLQVRAITVGTFHAVVDDGYIRLDNVSIPFIDIKTKTADILVSTESDVEVDYFSPTDFTCLIAAPFAITDDSNCGLSCENVTEIIETDDPEAPLNTTTEVCENVCLEFSRAKMFPKYGENPFSRFTVFNTSMFLSSDSGQIVVESRSIREKLNSVLPEMTIDHVYGGRTMNFTLLSYDALNTSFHPGGNPRPVQDFWKVVLSGPGAPPGFYAWVVSNQYVLLEPWLLDVISLGLLTPSTITNGAQLRPGPCPYFDKGASNALLIRYMRLIRESVGSVLPSGSMMVYKEDFDTPYRIFKIDPQTNQDVMAELTFEDAPIVLILVVLAIVIPVLFSFSLVALCVVIGRKKLYGVRLMVAKAEIQAADVLAEMPKTFEEVDDDIQEAIIGRSNFFYLIDHAIADPEVEQPLPVQIKMVVGHMLVLLVAGGPLWAVGQTFRTSVVANNCPFASDYQACLDDVPFPTILSRAMFLIFCALSFCEVMLHYLSMPMSPFRRVLRRVFYLFFFLSLAVSLAYIVTITIWTILGVIVNPTRIMPYVIAIAGTVGHCKSFQGKMQDFKDRIDLNIKHRLHELKKRLTKHLPAEAVEMMAGRTLNKIMHEYHLTPRAIIVALIVTLLILFAILIFLFIGFMAFTDPTSISASAINSGLVGGATLVLNQATAGKPPAATNDIKIEEMATKIECKLDEAFEFLERQVERGAAALEGMMDGVAASGLGAIASGIGKVAKGVRKVKKAKKVIHNVAAGMNLAAQRREEGQEGE